MKILIITQWYDPEPTFKGQLFAKSLAEAGHEVQVITGFPNYPGGKVYDGYKIKPYTIDWIDGVKVCRVALYPSHNQSGVKRAFNYLSFAFSSFLFGLLKAHKADVIYAYHPPLTTSFCAALLGKLKRIPVVIDIQDLWPDTLKATGMINSPKVLGVVNKLCNLTYRMCNRIVVLSPGFKRLLKQRGVPESKLDVIYNWCDEKNLTASGTTNHKLPELGFNIVFAGNMGPAQGIMSVIDAAGLLQQQGVKANIIFVGSGLSEAEGKSKVAEEAINNVFFIPRVPMSEVGCILDRADALLVHLVDDPLFRITIPSKTQAYMAMGKPIIMAVKGDCADLIEQAGAGVSCHPQEPQALASAITRMVEAPEQELALMGERGASFYHKELSLAAGTKKFLHVFDRMSSGKK
jgi:glycosyltransferase involved in cell wall biosynthesis